MGRPQNRFGQFPETRCFTEWGNDQKQIDGKLIRVSSYLIHLYKGIWED